MTRSVKGKSFYFLIGFLSQWFSHQHPELDAIWLVFFFPYRKKSWGLEDEEAEGKKGVSGMQPCIFLEH